MARNEQDREDLLRDATALSPRGEFALPAFAENVVIGFRRGGAVSLFFGADPALHFTADARLRRAFVNGLLLKAESGALVQMRRVRTENEVQMRSRPMNENEQATLLARFQADLSSLERSFSQGQYELIGEAPTEGQIAPRASEWLRTITCGPILVADSPHVDSARGPNLRKNER